MAVHTNDVALLRSSSQLLRFCENLIFEDNFNNTFALHHGGASAKVEKVFQIFAMISLQIFTECSKTYLQGQNRKFLYWV